MKDFYGFSSQPVSAGPSHTILAGATPPPSVEAPSRPSDATVERTKKYPDTLALPFKTLSRQLQYLKDVKLFLQACMSNVDARIEEVEQEILLEGENQ